MGYRLQPSTLVRMRISAALVKHTNKEAGPSQELTPNNVFLSFSAVLLITFVCCYLFPLLLLFCMGNSPGRRVERAPVSAGLRLTSWWMGNLVNMTIEYLVFVVQYQFPGLVTGKDDGQVIAGIMHVLLMLIMKRTFSMVVLNLRYRNRDLRTAPTNFYLYLSILLNNIDRLAPSSKYKSSFH